MKKKLKLSKETLSILDDARLRQVVGGATFGTCGTETTRRATDCNCSEFCQTVDCSFSCQTNSCP